jgi:signal transduction histidine kinase
VLERVNKAIDHLDTTITEIRTSIFELSDGGGRGGLRHGVLELAGELAPILGARPEVTFNGPVDSSVPQEVADHLLAVMREALTNASKYAHATHFIVSVSVLDDVTLVVEDDGVGIVFPLTPKAEDGRGLTNMRNRAQRVRGSFEIQAVDGGGTRVLWSAPV